MVGFAYLLGNELFRVAGILKPVEPLLDRAGVLLSLDGYQSIMFRPGGVHEPAVKTDDIEGVAAAKSVIEQAVARRAARC